MNVYTTTIVKIYVCVCCHRSFIVQNSNSKFKIIQSLYAHIPRPFSLLDILLCVHDNFAVADISLSCEKLLIWGSLKFDYTSCHCTHFPRVFNCFSTYICMYTIYFIDRIDHIETRQSLHWNSLNYIIDETGFEIELRCLVYFLKRLRISSKLRRWFLVSNDYS